MSFFRNLRGKPLLFWVRLFLGAVFILAGIGKIHDPGAFAQLIHNYQVFPEQFINGTAILLPWLEFVVGLLLVLGIWLPGAVLTASGLLIAFWALFIFNVLRGLDVHCGCFSLSAEGAPATAWYIARDTVFLLLAGYLFFGVFVRAGNLKAASREE